MPLATLLVTTLGPIIAKSLLKRWLGDTILTQAAGGGFDVLVARFKESATIEQKIERISQRIAASLADLEGLTADMEPVVHAVADTLQATPLEPQLLARENLDARRVATQILEGSPVRKDLRGRERDLHDRMVSDLCRRVIAIASSLPRFTEHATAATLDRLEVLDRRTARSELMLERLDSWLVEQDERGQRWFARLEKKREDKSLKFERTYREAVAEALDRVELFGVSVDEERRDYPLSVAYIQLCASEGQSGAANNEAIRVEHGLARGQRLLVRGDPGSGKTTLFRWLAVRAARQDFEGALVDWNGVVPFYLPLRQFVRRNPETKSLELRLPTPDDYVKILAEDLAGDMPDKWVFRLLEQDRALVLVDGVDEVPESLRGELQKRLKSLARICGPSRMLVSSRSYALSDDWGETNGFGELTLRDLALTDVDELIDQWHAAVADNLRFRKRQKEAQDLYGQAASLKREVRASGPVRHLARSPLLCALICALYRDRRRTLPETRIQLYDECLKLLLTRREKERDVDHSDYPPLTEPQKLVLLRNLAYWYLEHGYSEADAADVDDRFTEQLEPLGLAPQHLGRPVTGKWLREYLVHRSGILRSPSVDRVDFTHKTFLEFLAAQQVVKADHIPTLCRHLADDQWHEVIVLAAGLGTDRQRRALLDKVLNPGVLRLGRKPRFTFLAAACAEVCEHLDPSQRTEIQSRIQALIPAQDEKTERAIGIARELALPHLRLRPEWSEKERLSAVRILIQIGGPGALALLEEYVSGVSEELLFILVEGWNEFDRHEYARRVLSLALTDHSFWQFTKSATLAGVEQLTNLKGLKLYESEINDFSPLAGLTNLLSLELNGSQIGDLSPIACLTNLSRLSFSGTQVTNLTPLARLTELQTLELNGTQVADLSPLTNLSYLRKLDLRRTRVTDLSPLARLTNLEFLDLRGTQVADLTPLADLTKLQSLELNGTQVTDLSPLARLTKLYQLDLGEARVVDLSPLAKLVNLQYLYLHESQVGDVSPLADLISLRSLELDSTLVSNLSPLTGLANLHALKLSGTPTSDLSPLAELAELQTLELNNTQITDLSPLAHLSKLQSLELNGTQVTDLSPLARLTELHRLALGGTRITDLSPLAKLVNLNILDLGVNPVADLTPLVGLTRLDILGSGGGSFLAKLSSWGIKRALTKRADNS